MPLRSFADVPNRIVRLFLQEAGRQYDENRGLPRFGSMTPALTSRFGGCCAYCGAIELDPGNPLIADRYADFLAEQGEPVRAEALYRTAVDLEPLDEFVVTRYAEFLALGTRPDPQTLDEAPGSANELGTFDE
jgi:predicted Zn-dependent protease